MLDLRHIAGDVGVSGPLRDRVYDLWRASAPKRVDELRELTQQRWDIAGEGAFLLEPNLKDSSGGLRDAQTLSALAAAQLVDVPVPVREAARRRCSTSAASCSARPAGPRTCCASRSR